MNPRKQFDNAKDALTFILAGNATITLVSTKTGTHFTYRIRKPDPEPRADEQTAYSSHVYQARNKPIYFVSLLTGPDNENAYQYLGCIFPSNMSYVHGKKSKIGRDAPSAKAFEWAFRHLFNDDNAIPNDAEIWHEGKCGRCGRKLTVPESIDRGIGPECATKGGF